MIPVQFEIPPVARECRVYGLHNRDKGANCDDDKQDRDRNAEYYFGLAIEAVHETNGIAHMCLLVDTIPAVGEFG
jgi:hypothetical protein